MEIERRESHAWVHLVLTLIAVSWAFNNMVMKVGFTFVSAQQFGGIRMLLVFPFMLYFAFFSPSRVPFTRRDALGISLIGLVGLGLFQTLFPRGISETSAPLGGVLIATMPVHTLILSLVFRFEKVKWRPVAGVLLTLVGLLVIMRVNTDLSTSETTVRGILFVVVAELGFAINTTFLRPYMERYPLVQVTGLSMSVSVVLYNLVYLNDMKALLDTPIAWQVWPLTMYSGFIAFMVANILWNTSVTKIGSTQVSVYGNLPTVFVLLFSALMFNQVLTGLQLFGSALILCGVILVQFRRRLPSARVEVSATAEL